MATQYGYEQILTRGRLAALAALVGAAAVTVGARSGARSAAPGPASVCPSAVHRLGRIAFVARGQLDMVDLRSCRVRRLAAGSAWSPQFSPDGRWLAYSRRQPDHSGSPVVVAATGGPARSPLGARITTWWWAPHGAILYGV